MAPLEVVDSLAHLYNADGGAGAEHEVEYQLAAEQAKRESAAPGAVPEVLAAPVRRASDVVVPFVPDTEDEFFTSKKDGKSEALLKQMCKKGYYEKVAMVLRRPELRINATRKGGSRRTGLHVAADAGFYRVVRMLLAAGANPHKRDAGGQTPYDLAKAHNYANVTVCLLKAMRGLETGTVEDGLWCPPEEE